MLHTDVALAAFADRRGNVFEFHLGIADGWLALADDRRSAPGSIRSRWNVAVARLLLASGDVALAERHLARIVERIPGDAGILLAYGTVKETQATRQRAGVADGRPEAPATARLPRDTALEAAADLFEKALAADSSLAEARLRLAHVRMLQGDARRADTLFAALLASPSALPAPLQYLAALLHGRWLEGQGQADAAARRYVEAAQAVPGAQSAYLALARLFHGGNQREEAATVLDRLLERPGAIDPWWVYPLGLETDILPRFEALRREVRE
jgi:tetratricopeptide (TPR) repeat protein